MEDENNNTLPSVPVIAKPLDINNNTATDVYLDLIEMFDKNTTMIKYSFTVMTYNSNFLIKCLIRKLIQTILALLFLVN